MNRADNTAEFTHFARDAVFTGVTSKERTKWLELRKTMVTASDFAALLGEDPHKSSLDVYADKVLPPNAEELKIESPMFWGLALEQTVLRTAAEYYGWEYRAGGALLASRKYPFIGATLDAEVDRRDGRGWIVNECKNTEIHRNWDEEKQDCPVHVLIQCQSQLLVTGAPVDLCFALLSRYRPVRIEIEPNPEFHSILVEVAQEFLDRVKRLDPPPATARSGEALKRMFPHEDGTMVSLPPEAIEWSRELVEIDQQFEALKGRKEELRNLLRQQIGMSTWGILPEPVDGKRVWRWLTSTRSAHTVDASTSRTLLAMKEVKLPKSAGTGGTPRKTTPDPTIDISVPVEPANEVVTRFRSTRRRSRR